MLQMLTPEQRELATKLMEVLAQADRYDVMVALGIISQTMVGGYIPKDKRKEYAEYSEALVKHLLKAMDDFHKDRPSMPMGVHLFTLAHMYFSVAQGLKEIVKERREYDGNREPSTGEPGTGSSGGEQRNSGG